MFVVGRRKEQLKDEEVMYSWCRKFKEHILSLSVAPRIA
jgi:hypothetical protein